MNKNLKTHLYSSPVYTCLLKKYLFYISAQVLYVWLLHMFCLCVYKLAFVHVCVLFVSVWQWKSTFISTLVWRAGALKRFRRRSIRWFETWVCLTNAKTSSRTSQVCLHQRRSCALLALFLWRFANCLLSVCRWDAEEAVGRHRVRGRIQCCDSGRADSGSRSVCTQRHLGSAAQIQNRWEKWTPGQKMGRLLHCIRT